ncbi:class I SAM-dependent methyltransferase [Paenibacillus sp. CAA11]|uniref:class I SAM-dependent methyltransferase n=1 Tax=Paenibacillus sp. CAA11 TaxID=1532905 RepID=UPI00131F035A|nr:class I SAM-dependent methyltransferase [Paenibacillus sp. CAA11]
MKELILRFFPQSPAKVIDIGGAAGEYAFWFASLGHSVHLVDLVAEHIEQARSRALSDPSRPAPDRMWVADALALDIPDEQYDAVFLGGPLYHLTEREDRVQALCEARRILKPGGVLVAYGISRYASLMAGLLDGRIWREDFMEMLRLEIPTGQHVRCESNDKKGSLSSAFFHLPEELRDETEAAGFKILDVLGVLGPAWMAQDYEAGWQDLQRRQTLLEIARLTEQQPELGPRVLVAAVKPGHP